MDKISIIIPCKNEEKYIEGCLDSVIKNDYPKEYIEIFIVDGKSTDKTRAIAEKYSRYYKEFYLLINENETVPYALNMAIKIAKGVYLIRLDAHGEIPDNYFSELVKWGKKLNADNTGAGWITDVKNKNPKTLSIKKVLSHKFGVGNSYFRIGINEVKEVDTVPFGCFHRDVFKKVGLFDTRLTRNQDIELNKRIKRNKGKIYLLPHLSSKYFARETFSGIAKNNFLTGHYNTLTVYFTKKLSSLSLRHFIPFIFILSIVLPLFLMIWLPSLGIISLAILLTYLITVLIISIKIKDDETTIKYLMSSFLTLHFSYGIGSALGLFRITALFKKYSNE
jgi:glycosyltransferase involved in cell wall biosynthesis